MGVGRAALALAALVACRDQDPPPPAARPNGQTVKVAVIGGMIETGFWQALAERYQAARGNRVEVVAAGPKPRVVDAFRKGGIELIPETQQWIATFGRGTYDDQPLFFPVSLL